ncbi:MAG: AAA family ATPase [Bacteroidales bacterium]|nr:AAA family ATPase [Bacteroidales bacterium]
MIVIGITGTLGAGKGTIVDYLVDNKGFEHYSVRGFLLDEIKKRQLPENRDSMVIVANDLRKSNSPSFITDQLYEKAIQKEKNAVIESIRTPGEIISLKAKGNFYLMAINANPKVRYERIILRNSETDRVDYNTFIENENREMTSDDPHKQNLMRCIEMADYEFQNNGSVGQLQKQVDKVLKEIEIK